MHQVRCLHGEVPFQRDFATNSSKELSEHGFGIFDDRCVQVQVPAGTTVLEAARLANIQIPTLCYLKDLNCIGSCRVCLVDVEGEGLVASCNTAVREGMAVRTAPRR